MHAHAHLAEIDRVIAGHSTAKDAFVRDSWLRCINDHGLNPGIAIRPRIVSEASLRVHREKSRRLISVSRNILESLFRQVMGENYVLLLADAQGVAVDFFGHPDAEAELMGAGLYLGSDWSEKVAGTSGVGVCIETGNPIVIHESDHFNVSFTHLSCTAAPVFDSSGDLAAVLDLSLLRPPKSKVTQDFALRLVMSSAQRVEAANLAAMFRDEWIMYLAELPERLDLDPDAAVAFDHSGRIIGATSAATRLFKKAGAADTRSSETPIGRRISAYLDLQVDELPALARTAPSEHRLVYMTNGAGLFVRVKAPELSSADADPNTLKLPKRLVSLGYTDPSMKEVVNVAAKVAETHTPILIRGETGAGKKHLARAIHESRPFSEHFVVLSCAAFDDWFAKKGRSPDLETCDGAQSHDPLERAARGTLLLDEIADLSPIAQTRLLPILKQQAAAHDERPNRGRGRMKVLSSTSRDVESMIHAGTFRRDLYFYLAATTLHMPALRQRADFDWLLDRLLRQRSISYPRSYKLTAAARMELRRRQWPGNMRELINVLDIALALADGNLIDLEHLPAPVLGETATAISGRSLPEQADDLKTTLQICGWNISRAARRLGVDRSTVHRRMERMGITRPA